jgi:hypothetical protein
VTLRRLLVSPAVALLFGAVLAAPVPKEKEEKPGPITEEQLKDAANRMKQLGLALHTHNDANGFLPHNTQTKDGKPGLSWRVVILPFIEQENLYKQFKLDEAWDSDHNKKLIEKMPDLYAPIRVKTKEKGYTFYQGFDGKGSTFEAGKKLGIPAGFPDGTSNTVAAVEAGEPVIWTKPADLPFDATKPLPALGGVFDGDFHIVLMDGSVQKATGKRVDEKQFKLMVMRMDGNVIDVDAALGRK